MTESDKKMIDGMREVVLNMIRYHSSEQQHHQTKVDEWNAKLDQIDQIAQAMEALTIVSS